MKTTIKATNLKLTPGIKTAIEEKIAALDKSIPDIKMPLRAFVEIAVETRHHKKGQIFYAEATVEAPGKVIRSEARDENIYKAINTVRGGLQLLLKKYKEKQIAMRRRIKL